MVTTILVWISFLGILFVLLMREVLHFEESRRLGEKMAPIRKRFRRRLKILLVFLLFGVTYQMGLYLENHLDPRDRLVYYGMHFIQLIWILILAARDVNEIAQSYSILRTEVTLESLESIEKEVTRNKEKKESPSEPASSQDQKAATES